MTTARSAGLGPSLSSAVTFLVLICCILVLLPSSPLQPVSSSNVCICECCEGSGRCGRNNTQAYTIHDSCSSGCTKVSSDAAATQARESGEGSLRMRSRCCPVLCCLQGFCKARYDPCKVESNNIDVIANCVSQRHSGSREQQQQHAHAHAGLRLCSALTAADCAVAVVLRSRHLGESRSHRHLHADRRHAGRARLRQELRQRDRLADSKSSIARSL